MFVHTMYYKKYY